MPPRSRKDKPTKTLTGRDRPAGFVPKRPPSEKDAQRVKDMKPGKKKGELNDVIVTPDTRVRQNSKICGAKRTGRSSAGPGICCQPAGWGTNHQGYGKCRYHGGLLPNVEQAALKEQSLELAEKTVRLYGNPDPDIDPHTALETLLRATAGHVAWLANFIADLEDPAKLKQITDMGTRPAVWLEMYEKERRMLLDISKAAIAAGISERRVQIEEERGRMLAMVIHAVLHDDRLALTPAQLVVAPKLVREKILTLAMGQEDIEEAELVDEPA